MKQRKTGWENNFAPHVLERGVDYYEHGLVHELKQIDGTVTAVVSGSEDYEVELELVDGEISAMFCTCPYAEGGDCCKHMAAVCLAAGIGKALKPPKCQPEAAQEKLFRQTIEALTEPQLRELLQTLAAGDDELQSRIITQVSGRLPKGRMRSLKAKVDALTDSAEDADGYIGCRSAWEYTSALEDFLEREAGSLLSHGLVMEAFELTCYAFLTAATTEMDDSDGGLTSLGSCCSSLWEAQVGAAKPKQRQTMFAWFEAAADENPDAWFEDILHDAEMSLFCDAALMEKALAKTDARLAAAEKMIGEDTWHSRYEFSRAVVDRLSLMERLRRPPQELAAFRAKYHYLPDVRKAQIEEHIRARRYDEAIALLRESKTLDAEYPGLVAQYSKTLIELFEKTGQTKALTDELSNQVFACRQDGLQFVDRLKALTPPARWPELREEILHAKTMRYIRLDFLESEELWQRLLEEISAQGSLEAMDRFEKALRKRYPEGVKAFYLSCLRKRMPGASNRNAYRTLILYLKKAEKYPDGRQEAQELADEWRRSFPRRRSMLDELDKAGF